MPLQSPKYSMVVFEGKWSGNTFMDETALEKPFTWKKPRRIFVCSMGDLFHESVPFDWIDKVIDVIQKNPQHTFQILTKRPEILKEYSDYNMAEAIPNIWLGVTAENQEQADKRIPILMQTLATKRFVSIEPMLGPIDIGSGDALRWSNKPLIQHLDQVIVGGETGPGARPMHPDWVHEIRDQCVESNTPFFFKSWGEWAAFQIATGKDHVLRSPVEFIKMSKKKTGHLIEGKKWRQMP